MTMCLEKARRAWVRLPRPLHAALLELKAEHPKPVVFGTSHAVRFEPRLTDWRLTTTTPGPFDINGEIVRAETLNALGVAWAKHLPPFSNDKRTQTPLVPLADVLADLPQPIFDWLSGTPPIEKHAGGILFEALGVLLPDFRGESYNPSRELTLALDEVAFRRSGGTLRQDGPTSPLLSPLLMAALARCLDPEGVPWRNSNIDGRNMRSLLDTDGAGLIVLRTRNATAENPNGENYWTVPHHMRPVAQALANGETDPFRLTVLCPDAYKLWVANNLPINLVPPHPRLLDLIGVVKRKGKYDWRLTKDGQFIQPRVAAFLRAYESGTAAVPDDTPYDGEGVDIVLPDDDGPADSDWDILGATPEQVAYLEQPGFGITPETPGAADTISALDHLIAMAANAPLTIQTLTAAKEGVGGLVKQIVEAPVPSNADLAAAGARRRGDISATDADFDIL